jgi:ABC-2 type transport system ATP-binding protein
VATAIEVRGVSKHFRLYHEQFTSLKERMLHWGKVPYEDFWALKDVELEIQEGQTFGLLGHNGSGKSTLLKCTAGIIQPTSGEIVTRGRVAALLELGAGFQPAMSGRENIYLNASLLGMSRKYVDRCFDDIVAFAELEQFIDNQVKYYSSGMYVRLGFAVAVHMDPDILIVDEVLAVGDELFQRKCFDRVRQFQREGRTIVVVTHSPDLVRQVCDRAAVLDHGLLVGLGSPAEAVRSYREHLLRRQAYLDAGEMTEMLTLAQSEAPPDPSAGIDAPVSSPTTGASHPEPYTTSGESSSQDRADAAPAGSGTLSISYVHFEPGHSSGKSYVETGAAMEVVIGYNSTATFTDVVPTITVYDNKGVVLFTASTKLSPAEIEVNPGSGELVFSFDSMPLLDGDYPVTVGITSYDDYTVYDWQEQQHTLSVITRNSQTGLIYVPAKITVRDAVASGEPVRT